MECMTQILIHFVSVLCYQLSYILYICEHQYETSTTFSIKRNLFWLNVNLILMMLATRFYMFPLESLKAAAEYISDCSKIMNPMPYPLTGSWQWQPKPCKASTMNATTLASLATWWTMNIIYYNIYSLR